MSIEELIKNCEVYLKQIKQYEPDPYYVNYFLEKYLNSINNIIDGIFKEGNVNFGLFISGNILEEKFYEKAKMKKDQKAIEFSEWFLKKYELEHRNPYPNVIKKICQFRKRFGKLPRIKLMIRASDRYKDDIHQQIKVNLTHGKIYSKDEIEIEIKRQLPVFLEIINDKRNKRGEPKVRMNQVTVSTFLDIEDHSDVEVSYAVEIYIPVLKRLVEESREKMKELTSWR